MLAAVGILRLLRVITTGLWTARFVRTGTFLILFLAVLPGLTLYSAKCRN
jgi:hypothetical protein